MKKKMNNDFMFKDSYIWVIPRTRTLHWYDNSAIILDTPPTLSHALKFLFADRSKTKGDAGDSKYLLLDTVTGVDPTAPPKGEFKGIVKRVRVSGPNLLITVESGDFLELKVCNFLLGIVFVTKNSHKINFLLILLPFAFLLSSRRMVPHRLKREPTTGRPSSRLLHRVKEY